MIYPRGIDTRFFTFVSLDPKVKNCYKLKVSNVITKLNEPDIRGVLLFNIEIHQKNHSSVPGKINKSGAGAYHKRKDHLKLGLEMN